MAGAGGRGVPCLLQRDNSHQCYHTNLAASTLDATAQCKLAIEQAGSVESKQNEGLCEAPLWRDGCSVVRN